MPSAATQSEQRSDAIDRVRNIVRDALSASGELGEGGGARCALRRAAVVNGRYSRRDYQDLAGAALVMITAGINEKAGGAIDRNNPMGRLRLLGTNAEIYKDIVPRIVSAAAGAVLMIITDPPDALADVARCIARNDTL